MAYSTVALTVFTLVFGELIPKSLGVSSAEMVARIMVGKVVCPHMYMHGSTAANPPYSTTPSLRTHTGATYQYFSCCPESHRKGTVSHKQNMPIISFSFLLLCSDAHSLSSSLLLSLYIDAINVCQALLTSFGYQG